MSEWRRKLERQADWKKALRSLPWPEKVRMAEKIRESVKLLRAAPLLQTRHNITTEHGP
jgi:hypothetical protein